MYHAPLHRKLLPWAYGLLFCIVAPLILFYTAGYRYNTKKAAIEKFGTLIVDSVPSNADISINGAVSEQSTPATFQELVPGWHRVRVEKPGYHTWEKTLELRAERATFADRIQLFRTSPTIQRILTGDIRALAANPERDTLVALDGSQPTSTRIILLQSRGRISAEHTVDYTVSDGVSIRWQEDGRAVLLDDAQHDTLLRLTSRGIQTSSTTALAESWNGNDLLLTYPSSTIRWNARTGFSAVDLHATNTLAMLDRFQIITSATGTLLRIDRTFSTQYVPLPDGNWSFADLYNNQPLLRDGERWLWVSVGEGAAKLVPFTGLAIVWSPPDLDIRSALILAGNELYVWTPGSDPLLLMRQSSPIRTAVWHRSGDGIFVATDTTVEYIELDERGGHVRQPLLTFDRLQDMDVIGSTLYVAGSKDQQSGVWTAVVE